MPAFLSLRTGGARPDLMVQTADQSWHPAYRVVGTTLDGAERTMVALDLPAGAEVITPERLDSLASAGRVLAVSHLIAVVNDDPPARDDAPVGYSVERRSSRLNGTGATRTADRWENLRRLLNARCGQLEKTTGEDHDEIRHRAASVASDRRTESSMDLTESEMEDAVTAVEHELWEAGFDIEKADAEYAERRAQKMAA